MLVVTVKRVQEEINNKVGEETSNRTREILSLAKEMKKMMPLDNIVLKMATNNTLN